MFYRLRTLLFLGLLIIQIGIIRAEERVYDLLGSDEGGSILESGLVLEAMTRIVSDSRGGAYWQYRYAGDSKERIYRMIRDRHAFAIIEGSALLKLLSEDSVIGGEIRQVAVLWREALLGFIVKELVQTGNFNDMRALGSDKIGFIGSSDTRNRLEEQILVNLGFRDVLSWREFVGGDETNLEGVVFVSGVPNSFSRLLLESNRWDLLSMNVRQVEELSRKTGNIWRPRTLRGGGKSGLDKDLRVMTQSIYIVSLSSISSKVVYELTGLLFRERCYLESILGLFRATPPVREQLLEELELLELHDGSKRFYQEELRRESANSSDSSAADC